MIQLQKGVAAGAGRRSPPAENDRLADEIAELAAHLHAATYRLLTLLREYDAREAWGWGFKSCAHWLSWRTGIAPGAAREKVRVARALGSLPQIGAAMERGELSYSKVRALTRVATADNEAELLELARCATASHVERVVRAWRRVDRLEEAEEERACHERRHVELYPDEDGSWVLRGRLDPEIGALLEKALEWARLELYGKRLDPGTSPGQRRGDALGLVAEQALAASSAAPAKRADRLQVVLHTERAALEREAADRVAPRDAVTAPDACAASAAAASDAPAAPPTGDSILEASGHRVPAETSRRLSCDASLIEMTHDAEGNVLDVGRRRRTVPAALRRALERRDGRRCRFPGCDSRFCDAHHVEHWTDGGATRLDNLLLLCRAHHRAVHEGGMLVELDADGVVRFRTPWGWPVPEVPATPPLGGGVRGADRLRWDQERAGLEIDAWTATPNWHGERLDLDWTIYVMRREVTRRDGEAARSDPGPDAARPRPGPAARGQPRAS